MLTGIFGCATPPRVTPNENDAIFRTPTKAEFDMALALSRQHALNHLNLSQEELDKVKPDKGIVILEQEESSLLIQFYDPTVFPESEYLHDGIFEGMCGGFPSYFNITVDLISRTVIGAYSSDE